MAKAKKFIIGVLTAGLMATTVCFTTNASTNSINLEVPGDNAYFKWGAGFAQVLNTRDQSRWASASVQKVNRRTGQTVDSDSDGHRIDYYEIVEAKVSDPSITDYFYVCEGKIYMGGSPNSPTENNFSKRYPE